MERVNSSLRSRQFACDGTSCLQGTAPTCVEINVKMYRELFNIDRMAAYRDLTDLVNKGAVKKQGKVRATWCVLV